MLTARLGYAIFQNSAHGRCEFMRLPPALGWSSRSRMRTNCGPATASSCEVVIMVRRRDGRRNEHAEKRRAGSGLGGSAGDGDGLQSERAPSRLPSFPSTTQTQVGENKPSLPSRFSHLQTRVEVVENKSSYGSHHYPPAGAEVVELDDGRRVATYYEQGRGLVEQHYSAQARAWSKPQLLYMTQTDPCASITLKNFGGTVAVIANFARFCTDGEPPSELIAAVASTTSRSGTPT